jgi:ribonuclease BN (tRNA processing enzyme)
MLRPPAAASVDRALRASRVRWTVLGASAVRPNPGAACSGYLLEADGAHYLIDCGPGVLARLQQHVSLADLTGALISHSHPDHCLELVILRQALRYGPGAGRPASLPVYVAPGMHAQLVTLGAAFIDDARAGPSVDYWSPVIEQRTFDPDATLDLPGLTVAFAPTRHYVPCWAMRFTDRRGKVIVYGADGGPSDEVTALAAGADLLVLECTFPTRRGREADLGHLAPEEAGRIAAAAGARRLILTHTFSADDHPAMRAAAAAECDIPVEWAREGASWTV